MENNFKERWDNFHESCYALSPDMLTDIAKKIAEDYAISKYEKLIDDHFPEASLAKNGCPKLDFSSISFDTCGTTTGDSTVKSYFVSWDPLYNNDFITTYTSPELDDPRDNDSDTATVDIIIGKRAIKAIKNGDYELAKELLSRIS
jgi:hypothetical protein